ncbi:probable ribosome biogenesis protein RLP24 [Penaeus indicus]|uniref:probable ribosome biogenesis protein RLP24 n=1 Tax=Penaeus indicus TaxID=29960 RepID=UPI00300C3DCF
MRIERCYFCSKKVYPGHGIQFVRNDSKVFKFCSGRCNKHFKRKRNPRRTKWSGVFRKASGKELTVDPAFEFEKRRNVPVKYNRELWEKTVDAMKRAAEIKEKRENHHIMNRLVHSKEVDRIRHLSVVYKHLNVLYSPAAGLRKGNKVLDVEEAMEDEGVMNPLKATTKMVEEKIKKRKLMAEEAMEEDEGAMIEEGADD